MSECPIFFEERTARDARDMEERMFRSIVEPMDPADDPLMWNDEMRALFGVSD